MRHAISETLNYLRSISKKTRLTDKEIRALVDARDIINDLLGE